MDFVLRCCRSNVLRADTVFEFFFLGLIIVLIPSQVFGVELLTKTSQAGDFVSIVFVFRRVPRTEQRILNFN